MSSYFQIPSQRLYGFSLEEKKFSQWPEQMMELLEVIQAHGINLVEENLNLCFDRGVRNYFFGFSIAKVIKPIAPFKIRDLDQESYLAETHTLESLEVSLEKLLQLIDEKRTMAEANGLSLGSEVLLKWNFINWDSELKIFMKVKRAN